jgi:N6-L-threonylcarbamoyladenine synthase
MRYPYLMLLVSGGHCQFLHVKGPDDFTRLGGTIDDAPGEAFDKVARIMGLPQPGGPSVEKAAQSGDARRFSLPRPLLDREGCDMSFSGLKTAVLRQRDQLVAAQDGLFEQDRADICASFQAAMRDVLAEKSRRALALADGITGFAVAGGVAANQTLRKALEAVSDEANTPFVAPPLALCTDNAAMIAMAGLERYLEGARDDMTLSARPRWPLDQSAHAMLGSGKKGAKA